MDFVSGSFRCSRLDLFYFWRWINISYKIQNPLLKNVVKKLRRWGIIRGRECRIWAKSMGATLPWTSRDQRNSAALSFLCHYLCVLFSEYSFNLWVMIVKNLSMILDVPPYSLLPVFQINVMCLGAKKFIISLLL